MNAGIIGAVVTRREPFVPPDMTPASLNVRPLEKVYPHEAPEKRRQSEFPARPARMPIAVFQSVASILSVMKDEFGSPLWAPIHTASTTTRFGRVIEPVTPDGERANIKRKQAEAYGSTFQLDTDAKYDLLMGAA